MTRDEADQEISERISKLCKELELTIQEATNRGLYVSQVQDRCGMLVWPARPISFKVTRTINFGAS